MQNKTQKIIISAILLILVILFAVFTFFNNKNTKIEDIHPVSFLATPQEGNQMQNPLTTQGNLIQNTKNTVVNNEPIKEKTEIKNTDVKADFATLIAGDMTVNLQITQGQTLYEVLQNEENQKLISFAGRQHTGLGFFVTDIGNLHSGGGKDLLYYVNGIEASSGISVYVPKKNDVIEWKLE